MSIGSLSQKKENQKLAQPIVPLKSLSQTSFKIILEESLRAQLVATWHSVAIKCSVQNSFYRNLSCWPMLICLVRIISFSLEKSFKGIYPSRFSGIPQLWLWSQEENTLCPLWYFICSYQFYDYPHLFFWASLVSLSFNKVSLMCQALW